MHISYWAGFYWAFLLFFPKLPDRHVYLDRHRYLELESIAA